MEIEFNPNRVGNPNGAQPAGRQETVRRTTAEVPFESTGTLEERLRNLPDVRSDKVDGAKLLVANVKYPPVEILDRIAHLLAIRMN